MEISTFLAFLFFVLKGDTIMHIFLGDNVQLGCRGDTIHKAFWLGHLHVESIHLTHSIHLIVGET